MTAKMERLNMAALPPGYAMKEQLSDRGMSQKEFAVRMDMSEKHISKLINGEVQLTFETALRLELVLGVPARVWIDLESAYREEAVRTEAEKLLGPDAELSGSFPYSEMARLGWVPAAKDSREKAVHLRKYFEVVRLSLLENGSVLPLAGRSLHLSNPHDLAALAWAQQARLRAREIQTFPYSVQRLLTAIPDIRRMTLMKPKVFGPKLQQCLAGCGIALVFLPHLKGSALEEVLLSDGNQFVLGFSVKGRDSDQFWFCLFRELARAAARTGRTGQLQNERETSAEAWAENALIDDAVFSGFCSVKDFSERSVLRFSEEQGIAPGITVGRLQREGLIRKNRLNQLKEAYELRCD